MPRCPKNVPKAKPAVAPKLQAGNAAKRARAENLIAQVGKVGLTPEEFEQLALNIVAPDLKNPTVFPSPVPGRAGTAHFPLIVTVDGSSSPLASGSWGLTVRPSACEPVLISSQATEPFHANDVTGAAAVYDVSASSEKFVKSIVGSASQCTSLSENYDDTPGMPLDQSSTSDITVVYNNVQTSGGKCNIQLWAWNGANWVRLSNTTNLGGGGTGTDTFSYASSYKAYTFTSSAISGNQNIANVNFEYTISTISTWRCASTYDENVMASYQPDWESLKFNSRHFRVVACSALATFSGDKHFDGGRIAACNTTTRLEMDENWYQTITKQPFDVYDGALAPNGKSEGGAHWHFVADDPQSLLLTGDGHGSYACNPSEMAGYMGIEGMNVNQSVRLRFDFIVNFFSYHPEYNMVYQPPFTHFSQLIHLLRTEVPLVSSNDWHSNKAIAVARNVAKRAAKHAYDNPSTIQAALQALLALL